MLRWRITLGILIVATLVGLAWADHGAALPGTWLIPVLVLAVMLATQEIAGLESAGGLRPVRWVDYVGNLSVAAAGWFPVVVGWLQGVARTDIPEAGCEAMVIALGGAVVLAFGVEIYRYQRPGGRTGDLAATVFSLVYVGVLLGFHTLIRMGWGVGAMASVIIVTKMGDTGAYTIGRLFGRHKLAPALSPGKTVEGAAGAIAFALLGSWVTFQILMPRLGRPLHFQAPWWGWILFGIAVGAVGMLGDLAESLLKRDVGKKDSSTLVPGFGGVLDILDSLLLAAPVAYVFWRLGIVG
jgi:phosphatidate cytidylyltransferase